MRLSLASLIVLLGFWMAASQYVWFCHVRAECGTTLVSEAIARTVPMHPPVAATPVSVLTGTLASIEFDRGLDSAHLRDAQAVGLARLVAALRRSPGAGARLVGGYQPGERAAAELEGLGLARADFVRRLITAQGVAPERIVVSAEALSPDADPAVRIYLQPGPSGR